MIDRPSCDKRHFVSTIKYASHLRQKGVGKMKRKKIIITLSVISICAVLFCITATALFGVVLPARKLNKALSLLETGEKRAAYILIEKLANNNMLSAKRYEAALTSQQRGDYAAAFLLLSKISYKNSAEICDQSFRKMLFNAKKDDRIYFGAYEQDNNSKNGPEAICWRVLREEKEGSLLLLSEYALDCQPFHDTFEGTTWENASLRRWLNEEFLNQAFQEKDRALLLPSAVSADKNPGYSTDPGNDTEDRIFLLSTVETMQYFSSDEERRCYATDYASSRGAAFVGERSPDGALSCAWWTRTPGAVQNQTSLIFYDGRVEYYGHEVIDTALTIRPALRVSRNALDPHE